MLQLLSKLLLAKRYKFSVRATILLSYTADGVAGTCRCNVQACRAVCRRDVLRAVACTEPVSRFYAPTQSTSAMPVRTYNYAYPPLPPLPNAFWMREHSWLWRERRSVMRKKEEAGGKGADVYKVRRKIEVNQRRGDKKKTNWKERHKENKRKKMQRKRGFKIYR